MTSPVDPQDPWEGDADLHARSSGVRRGWWVASVAVVALAAASSVYVLAGRGHAASGGAAAAGGHAVVTEPAAEHPSGASVAPRVRVPGQGPQRPTKARYRGHVIEVVNNGSVKVCALISSSQVSQIMGTRLRPLRQVAVGTFDECATSVRRSGSSGAAAVRVAWAVPPEPDPALPFRQMTINLPRSDAVQGLGEKAYCSSQGSSASELFVLTGRHFLETFADTCAHAEALARIELGQL
jgi:hypothetical protein